jgi:hypothetical protein
MRKSTKHSGVQPGEVSQLWPAIPKTATRTPSGTVDDWWIEYSAEGTNFQAEIKPRVQVERLDLKTLDRRKRVGVNALHP